MPLSAVVKLAGLDVSEGMKDMRGTVSGYCESDVSPVFCYLISLTSLKVML
ncbi:Uncharacterised protein [Chlamydia trachomatis]|jgi:hypothetical protein|nr:Uncharacterised protein [Chlamydia trachomatis]